MNEVVEVHRLAAFSEDPTGGNPAGVVLTDEPLADVEMQRIAAEVGYSETAFLASPSADGRTWQVRYFAPTSEVPFCGHATIASAVLLGRDGGRGRFQLETSVGTVPVEVGEVDGRVVATLTSVIPSVEEPPPGLVDAALGISGYARDDLDERFAPAVAFAGARHLVLVLERRAALARLAYDFEPLRELMLEHELTTVAFLWRAPDGTWHARNAFPVGGVVEDPATGAAAAALGGYLRATQTLTPPASFLVVQGEDMGRPSFLRVAIPDAVGGVEVSGTAMTMT